MPKPNYRFERSERDRTKQTKRKKRRDGDRSGRLRRNHVRQSNPSCRPRAMTNDKTGCLAAISKANC
jgi:hypothetical protein